MSERIAFFAEGLPKGQPRPKAFSRGGHARVYDPGTAEGWKGIVALAAREHRPKEPLTDPVRLVLGFRFPRPKSHYRKRDGKPVLRDEAPDFHIAKPDADNLAKAVMDALSQIGIWRDDAQVAVLRSTKMYEAGCVGCWISIEPITNAETSDEA